MANLKDLAESRGTLLNFDPRKLKIKAGFNARDLDTPDNKAHIEWLATSIAEEGVKQPLVIYMEAGEAYIVEGHCRLTATMLAISRGADIATVPCIPEARGTSTVDRLLSQAIYNTGKRLEPLELGANFKRAVALGYTVKQISEKVGKSVSYINQMIALQAAPTEVHNLIKEKKVSANAAAKTLRKKGAEKGVEAIKREAATPVAADMPWKRLRGFVAANKARPEGVSDEDIINALTLLGEP